MATNFYNSGETVVVTAPYALDAGDGCIIGDLFGVAIGDAASGATAVLAREGVFDLEKASGASGYAFTAGESVYWDPSAKVAKPRTEGTGAVLIGIAIEAAASTATTVRVAICGRAQGGRPVVVYRARFDATGGKAVGTHDFGPELPSGFRVMKAWTEVQTTFTSASADAGTIALGFPTDAASGLKAALAISDASNFWDAGNHDLLPDNTVATMITLTAARQPRATIATAALTAGVMDVYLVGVLP